jgi:hypothetical protein
MAKQTNVFEPMLSLWIVHLAAKSRSSNTLDCYHRDICDVIVAMKQICSRDPLLVDLCAIGQMEIDRITS